MTNANNNYLDMPDEDILQMSAPAAAPQPDLEQPTGVNNEPVPPAGAAGGEGGEDGGEGAPAPSPTPGSEEVEPTPVEPAPAQPGAEVPEGGAAKTDEGKITPPTPTADGDAGTPPATPEQAPAAKEPTPDDFKAFYDRILGRPIRANGKDIQLRSPEEAERLIQMGLNYTKKMHAWQPRMRVVTMLENNGLLDEAKLSHLIDLSKGDPLAIQKLLSDSKFDPMTVDADKAASYKPGNHQVSDTEMAFNAALDELETSPTGVELITEVAKQWDEQSRQAVYQDPNILRVINEQKTIGLYARITAEMDHLKSLGHLQGVPFLQAYKAVGDMLNDRGLLQQAPAQQPARTPVETRVAAPAPKVTNNERAAAASPTKATPAAVKQQPNYLDIPDEQFLREMAGRV